jgi:hypothetical protein
MGPATRMAHLRETFMVIQVALLSGALTACVGSQPSPSLLPKPTMYEWIGTGPPPSVLRLAEDKSLCLHEAERADPQKDPGTESAHRNAHLKRCMQEKGWGETAID